MRSLLVYLIFLVGITLQQGLVPHVPPAGAVAEILSPFWSITQSVRSVVVLGSPNSSVVTVAVLFHFHLRLSLSGALTPPSRSETDAPPGMADSQAGEAGRTQPPAGVQTSHGSQTVTPV